MQIIPDLGPSMSADSFSPGGQFTKAEGDEVSCESVYGSKKNQGGLTLDELKTIEMNRRAILLRVRTNGRCFCFTDI